MKSDRSLVSHTFACSTSQWKFGRAWWLSVVVAAVAAAAMPQTRAAKNTGDFSTIKANYSGTTVASSGTTVVPGTGTAKVGSRKDGTQGSLKLAANISTSSGALIVQRNLKFKKRNFRSTSFLISAGTSAPGTGSGSYKFKKTKINYTDNTVFAVSGMSTVVLIQGTARFTKKRAVITETWIVPGSTTVLTFQWLLKRRGK